jgi:hypothetical protein
MMAEDFERTTFVRQHDSAVQCALHRPEGEALIMAVADGALTPIRPASADVVARSRRFERIDRLQVVLDGNREISSLGTHSR